MNSQTQMIEERGICVFERINKAPLYNEPFDTSCMTIVLNIQGWLRGECDMREVSFNKHDIALVTPHHIFCAHESSDDYQAILIVMSADFQEEMRHRYPDIFRYNSYYVYQPDFHLDDEQFAVVERAFLLLGDVSRSDNLYYKTMAGNLLEVLFVLLQGYRRKNGAQSHQFSPHEELFAQFYQALISHFHESREVRYYASLFDLSPKYFSAIIKQHTGTGVSQWIANYVILQAKSMLRHRKQLNIQQLATQLGFPDQASFSRYFREHTSMTPTEYRDQYTNNRTQYSKL